MRLVTQVRFILSDDFDQLDRLADFKNSIDDSSPVAQGSVFIQLQVTGSYAVVPLPGGMTHIGTLYIDTDGPILCRLNTVDGTTGTEIPITPLVTPCISAAEPAPSPQVTASIQRGDFKIRAGLSADGNTVLLTSLWLKNPGIAPANVKVYFVGE